MDFYVYVVTTPSLNCKSQPSISYLSIDLPPIPQETTSNWRTINDINFLEQQEYIINLPNDPLIDSFVVIMFKNWLPGYKVQEMGDKEIDQFLKSENDLIRLDEIPHQFISAKHN